MDGDSKAKRTLYLRTPLVESSPMSKLAGFTVMCKMETAQANSCFKIRGIGNLMEKALKNGYSQFVCSSGGNAGMAAAYTARKLKVPIKIVVPTATPEFLRQRLRDEDAEVIVAAGSDWQYAHARAQEEAKKPGVYDVHPFDRPDIWEGHASIVREICEDLPEKPDLLVTSVGGGGLALGILQGLEQVGWSDVPLLCMETIGADCLYQAVQAGHLVTLPKITSVATCLGAPTVAEALFEATKTRPVLSEVINDKVCVEAIVKFLDHHKMLVEPACAAALAAVYSDTIEKLVTSGKLKRPKTVVVIVCGGLSASLESLDKWKKQFNIE